MINNVYYPKEIDGAWYLCSRRHQSVMKIGTGYLGLLEAEFSASMWNQCADGYKKSQKKLSDYRSKVNKIDVVA